MFEPSFMTEEQAWPSAFSKQVNSEFKKALELVNIESEVGSLGRRRQRLDEPPQGLRDRVKRVPLLVGF